MFDKQLPAHPNLAQYKKQAKELVRDCALALPDALTRVRCHHPRINAHPETALQASLTDAQLVLAREHGFESWPRFAAHIETLRIIHSVEAITDPVAAFIEVACIPRHADHTSGTLEHADLILQRYPEVATASIHTAAILGDETTVRRFLNLNPAEATSKGGPYEWDALTHLSFSRYLQHDSTRANAFLHTAETLLDAGASANTGFYEMIDHPNPHPILESAIYAVACIARHPELTQLLLKNGADPNDAETPYHVPESHDNTITHIMLESGKLTPKSRATILLRKTDWHDEAGLQLALDHGADPNFMTQWGNTALHHALLRDNSLSVIERLLNHGANPALIAKCHNLSATQIAAHRGRGDVLHLFEQRGISMALGGVFELIAACAKGDQETAKKLSHFTPELDPYSGTFLAQFAGNGNVEGLRCLLSIGISPDSVDTLGDPYFDLAKDSTALHNAAWRARPAAVNFLIAAGTPVNALDGRGRTALQLAVKATVDSYWTNRRTPESVAALLNAGAVTTGIDIPCGYDEVDELLRKATQS
jgi:ankyrin repeat protein